MRYRQLGRTGIDVSELVFGCGNVGGMMIRQPPEVMRAAVKAALDAGMNWFDTAAQYGDGQSEANLGRTLRELGASPGISTKGSVDSASGEPFAAQMERALEDSLARLGMERIALYQLHGRIATDGAARAVTPEQVLGPDGVLDAMERLRDRGKFDRVGITALGDTDAILEVIGSGRVDTCQVYINMINPTAAHARGRTPAPATGQDFAGVIDACRAHDVGVIAIRTMAAGILAGAAAPNPRAMLTEDTEIAEEQRKADAVFARLGDAYGTRAQTAIRYALTLDGVSCVDFAPGELAHLPDAFEAAEMGPLPADAMDALDALYHGDFRA